MKKILLIDDEKILNESLSDVVEALGHTVNSYLSIKETLEHEDFSSVNIIICDLGLPGEDAFWFAAWIKENFDHISFVILSAFSEEVKIKEGLQAGADRYLVKPPQLQELREILNTPYL